MAQQACKCTAGFCTCNGVQGHRSASGRGPPMRCSWAAQTLRKLSSLCLCCSVSVYPAAADAAWNQPYRATSDLGDAVNGTYGEGGNGTVSVKVRLCWHGRGVALGAVECCLPE